MKRKFSLFLLPVALYAQGSGGNPDPRWQTVGAGALASRPATCTVNRSVYICNGAGCDASSNFEIDYCTSTNTWTPVYGGIGTGGGSSGQFSTASATYTTTNPYYFPAGGGLAATTTFPGATQTPQAAAGTISSFGVGVSPAPSTSTLTFTWFDNASGQTVTCSITGAATSCTDVTHTFNYVAGDKLSIQMAVSGATYTGSVTMVWGTGQTGPAGPPFVPGGTATQYVRGDGVTKQFPQIPVGNYATLAASVSANPSNATIVMPYNYTETVTSTVVLSGSNLTLLCNANATFVKGANVPILSITGTNIVIDGCVFDGAQGSGFTGNTINSDSSTNLTIRNSTFKNGAATFSAINTQSASTETNLTIGPNNYFVNNLGAAFYSDGLLVVGTRIHNNVIDCSSVTSTATSCIAFHTSASGQTNKQTSITNNLITLGPGNFAVEIGAFAGGAVPPDQPIVQNNEITHIANGSSGSISYSTTTNGIIDGNAINHGGYTWTLTPIEIVSSTGTSVTGNTTSNAPAGTDKFELSLNASSNSTVTSNVLTGGIYIGSSISGSPHNDANTIETNVINAPSSSTYTHGLVWAQCNVASCTLSSNVIKGNTLTVTGSTVALGIALENDVTSPVGVVNLNDASQNAYIGTFTSGHVGIGGVVTNTTYDGITAGDSLVGYSSGTTLPVACTSAPMQVFLKTNATAGQNWYFCTAPNSWVQQLNTGSAGTVTTTGSPTSGNITKFSGATSITNGDLSGDVTTSGALATTLATVNSNTGVCGDATHVCQVTLNGKGLATAATAVAITTGGTGTVTTTGSPSTGNLSKFSGATSITNADLTGDVTTSGALVTTLATVNGSPGSCGDATHVCDVTTNGKGLVTSQSAISITATVNTSGSPISGNLARFSGATTVTNGNLSGDITTAGALVATLATVNSGPGTCGDSTHVCQVVTNGKGLVTSQTAVAITGGSGGSVVACNTAADTGSAYLCSAGLGSYTNIQLLFKPDVVSVGGATTINAGAGVVSIFLGDGATNPLSTTFIANDYYTLNFNGTAFVIQPSANLSLTGGIVSGIGSAQTGYWEFLGKTSGGQALSVPDIGGTPFVTLIPVTAGSAGQVLSTTGAATCPTLPSGAPATCIGTQWIAASAGGTVTTTGSPSSGNLAKFSGPTSIVNGDLSGDATTSGTLAVTLATVNSGPGSCGDSTHVCQVVTNGKGLVTSQTAVGISGGVASICSGAQSLGGPTITSGSSTTVTITCTGLTTGDVPHVVFASNPTGVTGLVPSTSGTLGFAVYPTSNTINVVIYNNTGGSITLGSMSMNYQAVR